MKRVKINNLSLLQKNLSFSGDLYTGLAYSFDDQQQLTGLFKFEEGFQVGESNDLLLFGDCKDWLRIDDDLLEQDEDYGPLLYQDIPFTGISYTFDERYCVAETVYENGEEEQYRTWYNSGRIHSISDGRSRTEWFENGNIKRQYSSGKHIRVVGQNRYDKIIFLNLAIPANDLQFLSVFGLSHELTLMGAGINRKTLEVIANSPGFDSVKRLKLWRTTVVADLIKVLPNASSLKNLILSENFHVTEECFLLLKAALPECRIELVNQTLDLTIYNGCSSS